MPSLDGFDKWLGKDNAGPWSIDHLTDAQKESLLWIGTSFIFALAFWRGIPWWYKWEKVFIDRQKTKIKEIMVLRWFPLLAPVKYLTVLFHEMSHAIMGGLSGGKPMTIVVDWNEGGCTVFDPKHTDPSALLTYPAGYVGSCLSGCIFIILGFDTLSSKYAFLFFEALALVSLLVCLNVQKKSWLHHQQHRLRAGFARLTGRHEAAKKHQNTHEEQIKQEKEASNTDSDQPSPKEKMVSVEVILVTNLFTSVIIGLTWYFDDSIYLRFVILFIGTINALYAIWDVFLDGIKYGAVVESDATLMAAEFDKNSVVKRGEKFWAITSLCIMISLLMIAIIAALYIWKGTIAQQATHARHFLPTPNHYSQADLINEAQPSTGNWFD